MNEMNGFVEFLKNILELPRLFQAIADITARLEEIERKIEPGKEWFDRVDCCRLRGVSKALLEQKPFLLPCFGVPEDTIPCHRWRRETFLKWYAVPLKEIQRRWERMTDRDRLRLIDMRKAA